MGENFEQRRSRWEKSVESVLVEMAKEKTPDGVPIRPNLDRVIYEFNILLSYLSEMQKLGHNLAFCLSPHDQGATDE